MDATITVVVLNGIGLGLGMYAWRKRAGMDPGPRLLLDCSSGVLGIALLCVGAALMLDYPATRGVFAVCVFAALGILLARSVRKRRAAQTVQATAAEPEPDQLRSVPLSALGTFIPAAGGTERSARAQAAMRKAVTP